MAKFHELPEMTPEDYAELPPLVAPGENRAEVLERVIDGWCTPIRIDAFIGAKFDDQPGIKPLPNGGIVLDRLRLVDASGDREQGIDLGELLRKVARRLAEAPRPAENASRPCCLLRGCWVPTCNAAEIDLRVCFLWSIGVVRSGTNASFNSATFGADDLFNSLVQRAFRGKL